MRLRTRLALAFAALAVLPLAFVLPIAQSRSRDVIASELAERVSTGEAVARATMSSEGAEVRRAAEDLAQAPPVEEVAQQLAAHVPPSRQAAVAERLMTARGLSVLSLLDRNGVTLSSGHLPGKLGDPDPALFSVAGSSEAGAQVARVEIRSAAGLREVPALVAAKPVDYGEVRLWVVGGKTLDSGFAEELAKLTGARVEIHSGDALLATSGSAVPPLTIRTLELGSGVAVKLGFSGAALLRAEREVTYTFAAAAGLGLCLAMLGGVLVARRITSPVEALTEGARRIARGELTAKVEARASGEVGELVEAFNRMTADLDRATQQLIASEKVAAWQEVARRLAHEIKNPLTPIQMSLETLLAAQREKNPRFGPLFQESAGVVLEEVERLRRIVDEFSRFARLPKPVLAPMDLGEFADGALALYASPPSGVEIRPELSRGIEVQADRDQLTQVLVNLVKNAVEVLPGGGTIWVRAGEREGKAFLEVEDTGPGIPPDQRARVLEPYFTTKQGGTGLGLAIAARIAQEHGGALEIDGSVGRGALIRLVLPRT